MKNTNAINQLKKDAKGYTRYYKTPVSINGQNYLLCSQWYEYNKDPLLKWLESKKR